MDLNQRDWRSENEHGDFLISTRIDKLDRDFINTALGSDDMYWAKSLSLEDLELMLAQSVTFGLFEALRAVPPRATVDEPSSPRDESPTLEAPSSENLKQIGMARLITDHVTFAYLTDVYIHPEHRGHKLAKWLIACVREAIQAHPSLRRFMLLTGSKYLVGYYERELGAWNMLDEPELTVMSGKPKKADGALS